MSKELDLIILKNLLTTKKFLLDFSQECHDKIFNLDYQRFAKILIDYAKTYRNLPTEKILLEKFQTTEHLVNYLKQVFAELNSVVVDEKEYVHYLEKIKNRYAKQLMDNFGKGIQDKKYEDIKKGLTEINTISNNIRSLYQQKTFDQKSLDEAVDDFKNKYLAKKKDPEFNSGIQTGYSFLDYAIGGLRNSELLLIAASTGAGKSTLLMNLGLNAWLSNNTISMEKDFYPGKNILYFSLEMGLLDIMERIISRLCIIPQVDIRDAKLNKDQEQKMAQAFKFMNNYSNYFEIVDIARNTTIESIEAIYDEVAQRRGQKPDLVIVDYLGLLDLSRDEGASIDDWLKQGIISERLHSFARVKDCVVMSAVQLNASSNAKDNISNVGLHRLNRSKQVAHNCNFVIQINDRRDEKLIPNMELCLIKARRCSLVSGTIYKDLSCCLLLDEAQSPISNVELTDISEQMDQ